MPLLSVEPDTPGSTAINGGAMTTPFPYTTLFRSTLGANTTLAGTDVTFVQTVQSPAPRSLLRSDEHTTRLQSPMYRVCSPLLEEKTDTPGTTPINGGAVTTTTTQTYRDPVTLGAN